MGVRIAFGQVLLHFKLLNSDFQLCVGSELVNSPTYALNGDPVTQGVVGRGGSLVDLAPFVRRVAGSNPAL